MGAAVDSSTSREWPGIYFARAMDDQDPAGIKALGLAIEAKLAERRMRLVDPYVQDEVTGIDVVDADLRLLKDADAVLMDMTIPNRNYVGCVCELVYAYQWQIPAVVVVGDSGNGDRLWLRYHARATVRDVDEALDRIQQELGMQARGAR